MNENTQSEIPNNPVKRLYRIIQQAKSKSETNGIRYVWSDVLGIAREDNIKLYEGVIELIKLTQTAKRIIKELDDANKKHYLSPILVIEQILIDTNLEGRWEIHKRKLTESVMLALEMAANTTSAKQGFKSVNQEELEKLQIEVQNLIEKVLKSEFESVELKNVVIKNLEQIRKAILFYRVSGAEGLREAVDGTIGALFSRENEINSEFENNKPISQIFKEMIALIANISQIVSLEIQLATLTANLPHLLGSGQ